MNSSSSSSFGSKPRNLGCISLFLQRFLCSRASSSSTYPSDQLTESDLEPHGDIGKHRRVNFSVEYVELQDDNFFILSFENDNKHDKRRNRETEKSQPLQAQVLCKEKSKNALLGHETVEIVELKPQRKEKHKKRRKRREIIHKETEKSQTHNECDENNKNASNAFSGELKLRRKEKRKKRRKRRENIQKGTEKSQPLQTHNECNENKKNASNASSGHETLIVVSPKKRQNIIEKFTSKELSLEKENCEDEEECGNMAMTTTRWSEYNEEMWLMICKITDSEIEESNWAYGKASKPEDIEETISEDIVSHILDQLLEETITNTFS